VITLCRKVDECKSLYHGFIPPNNPHDDAIVFTDIEHAISWHIVMHPELWDGPGGEAGGVLRASTGPASNDLLLLRASVRAFTLKLPGKPFSVSACSHRPSCEVREAAARAAVREVEKVGPGGYRSPHHRT